MDERDSAWFTRIYAKHYADVVRYGVRRLGDVDSATELAQEVFVVAWRRRSQVPDHSLPWLYGVARNLVANRQRQATQVTAVDPNGLSDVDTGVAEAVGSQAAAAVADVRAALARLPEPDQEILRLVGWEELTVGEAAEVLGCSRTAAGVRLHRARRRLLAELDRPRPSMETEAAPSTPSPRR